MLNITYAQSDAHTAEEMQSDLSIANLRLDNPILIALLTPDSVKDETVLSAIDQSKRAGHVIVPVILRQTTLPASLMSEKSLDLSKKYDKNKLIQFVKQADIGKERNRKNRLYFYAVGSVVLLMFVISLVAISSGTVVFPADEYATENAIRDAQVNTIVAPQIEVLRPRTTEDALNFDMTLEAIENDDLLPFVIGTATAIPEQLQSTNEARMTQAFSTEMAETQSASD
ncbi:MAG: hypothetical protein Phog2KO_24120 [Phototrophicaceae bacterium]